MDTNPVDVKLAKPASESSGAAGNDGEEGGRESDGSSGEAVR